MNNPLTVGKNKLAWIWFSICSFLLSSGAVICSCSTPNFVVWLHDHILQYTIHYLLWHVWKKFSSFSMRSRRSRHTFLRFFLLFFGEYFWDQLVTNFLHAQFLGQNVVDGLMIQIQLTTDHSDCQTSIKPHESPHFGHIFVRFLCTKSSRTRFVFHILTATQKCFMPSKNLYSWYSVLSISPF